jgi:hypothetical protein
MAHYAFAAIVPTQAAALLRNMHAAAAAAAGSAAHTWRLVLAAACDTWHTMLLL